MGVLRCQAFLKVQALEGSGFAVGSQSRHEQLILFPNLSLSAFTHMYDQICMYVCIYIYVAAHRYTHIYIHVYIREAV